MNTLANIKEVTANGDVIVEGYGIVFGGRDLDGESFTKETDFEMEYVPVKKAFYSHRSDPHVKQELGHVVDHRVDDTGVWFKMQLGKSHRYLTAVQKLIEKGVIGISTGTASQLSDRVGQKIVKWPIVEVSLTPTPAEPRTLGVSFAKEAGLTDEEIEALGIDSQSQEVVDEGEGGMSSKVEAQANDTTINVDVTQKGVNFIMSDELNPQDVAKGIMDEWKVMKTEIADNQKSLSTQLSGLIAKLEASPKVMGAGFVSQDGGKADTNVKSFADFLVAVRRNDSTRLASVYRSTKSWGEKDLTGNTGTAGGYLVPQEYEASLLQMANMNSAVVNRVTTIPVNGNSGRWPVLNQFITPTAGSGQTASAAGVKATTKAAGATLDETEPSFEMLEWRLHKIGGTTDIDNELVEDSPMAIEALLKSLFAIAISAKTERNIFRGSGAGEPLGILTSLSGIGVTPATDNLFSWPDVSTMYARFKSAGGQPVWVIHPSIWPDILTMEIGTQGANAWTSNMQAGVAQNLNGYPILTSEHLPQANNSGAVLLADLNAYLLFKKPGLSIDFSEHANFRQDQGVWRFTQRMDGMPWNRGPITLADPQGSYTVSPFVLHND